MGVEELKPAVLADQRLQGTGSVHSLGPLTADCPCYLRRTGGELAAFSL